MLLKIGDKGDAVRKVQQTLQEIGFDIKADGIFGKLTKAAVKEFQRQNGLDVDGIIGPDTLGALGLDLEANTTTIDFTEEETEVPPVAQEQIRKLSTVLAQLHDTFLEKLQDAVNNFETTMAFASTKEANPDLLGAMIGEVFDFVVRETLGDPGKVAVLARKLYTASRNELERAGKASSSQKVGEWIKEQREIIDRLRGNFNQDALQEEMELGYLEAEDQQAFFDALFNQIQQLQTPFLPAVSELERQLYEHWINAHFREIGDDSSGCIEFRIKVDELGFNTESCTVQAPEGDKVADALNQLIERLPDLKHLLDLRVRKRICFFVPNFVGGQSWSCGWLDQDNQLIHEPIHDAAAKAIRQKDWRFAAKFFD